MIEQEKTFSELTDEEALGLMGNVLVPPDHARIKVFTVKKGTPEEREMEEASWDEVVILDGIEQAENQEGRFDGFPAEQRLPEVWRASYHISSTDAETDNGGKRVTDFMEFIWDLATVGRATLEDYAKRYKGTSDPKLFWFSRFIDLQANSGKMARILIDTGHRDRLVKGQAFRGFNDVFDILPVLRGAKFVARIEQREDKNGVPRPKVKRISTFKG